MRAEQYAKQNRRPCSNGASITAVRGKATCSFINHLLRQSASPFVFASERGGPFTPSGFAKLLARAGDEIKIGFKVHPHMLRHACGYELANRGIDTRTLQAYLGHRSVTSTTRYAARCEPLRG